MTDELLPTPNAGNLNDGQSTEAWRKRKARERAKGYNGNGGGTPIAMAVQLAAEGIFDPNEADRRTSACSPGSEDSTSPSNPTDTAAPVRSSGTPIAPASSSDGGRLFPVGEMSPRSALLPTPNAADAWTPEATTENTMRRGDPHGPLRSTSGSLVKDMGRISSAAASPASQPPPQDADAAPPTTAGYGLSSPVSLASWDPATSSWRTSQASLLSTEDERFPRSWERWPTSGTTRRGVASALPTSALPTDANGCSYLPTVTAQDGANTGGPSQYERNSLSLSALLHTPTTGDTAPTYDHRASPGYTRAKPVPNLAAQIEDELLPTPRTSDANGKGTHGDGGPDLRTSLGDLTEERSTDGSEP